MKEITTTTTTVTTECIRRAPRKKTITKATHHVANGQILVTATYAPQRSQKQSTQSMAVPYIGLIEAKKMVRSGIIAPEKDLEALGTSGYGLAESLLHMAAIRDGLMKVTTMSIAQEDKERLQIIAAQLNEFMPIIKDVMLKHVSSFAETITVK